MRKGVFELIGIIAAMDVEARPILSRLKADSRRDVSGIAFVRGALEGREVVVARSGVGKVNAALCAQTMALLYAPSLVINAGVAGALEETLHVGDAVIGTDVVQYDVDTSALGDPPGLVSTVEKIYFPCDQAASQAIFDAAALINVHTVRARIASGDAFIAEEARKREILRQFRASACEMEAGAIAQVCYANGIPCAVIRAISDECNEQSQSTYESCLTLAAQTAAEILFKYLSNVENL